MPLSAVYCANAYRIGGLGDGAMGLGARGCDLAAYSNHVSRKGVPLGALRARPCLAVKTDGPATVDFGVFILQTTGRFRSLSL